MAKTKRLGSKFLKGQEIDNMENVASFKKQKRKPQNTIGEINIKEIHPLTENQRKVFSAYDDGKNILSIGSAGTGKSFLFFYLTLFDLLFSNRYSKIIIFRSAVPTRNIGFLPGNEDEKMSAYTLAYKGICSELLERGDGFELLKKKDMIEFQSTSFVRGTTFDNCLIIVEEIQDMNLHEISTLITRCGKNTRIFLCGDIKQTDLDPRREVSGIQDFIRIAANMDSFEIVEFGIEDIVRSGLVREYLVAKENLGL